MNSTLSTADLYGELIALQTKPAVTSTDYLFASVLFGLGALWCLCSLVGTVAVILEWSAL